MKKTLSILLALTMLLLTACGGGNNSGNSSAPSDTGSVTTPAVIDSIYTDLTGIPGEKTVVTVDGNEVPAALYLYWAVSSAQNLVYQLQMYAMYYGMYADAFGDDGAINWN